MGGVAWEVIDRDSAKRFCQYVTEQADEGIDRTYSIVRSNRSTRQHNALHLLFRQLAKALNDSGFMQKHPFNEEFEIPWSENSIKELFYKPIIQQMYDIESTRKLGTTQLSESANVMIDAINMKLGVFVPFPSLSEHL
jgi:hypothetical protein